MTESESPSGAGAICAAFGFTLTMAELEEPSLLRTLPGTVTYVPSALKQRTSTASAYQSIALLRSGTAFVKIMPFLETRTPDSVTWCQTMRPRTTRGALAAMRTTLVPYLSAIWAAVMVVSAATAGAGLVSGLNAQMASAATAATAMTAAAVTSNGARRRSVLRALRLSSQRRLGRAASSATFWARAKCAAAAAASSGAARPPASSR